MINQTKVKTHKAKSSTKVTDSQLAEKDWRKGEIELSGMLM